MPSPPFPELSILNHPPSKLPGACFLHELVRKTSVSAEPALDFLEEGSSRKRLSYESLHSLSNGLAHKIRCALRGLDEQSAIVPLLLPQSPELYITLLAILKAGKAFCPLNLDAPAERVKFILQDVSANLLITTSSLKDSLPPLANVQLFIVEDELLQCDEEHNMPDIQLQPEDLAYVLYTSGSTGLPKAVSISHRAVTQSILAHDRHIPTFARFLQFAAPTFDVSIFEIFFPLFRGRTLVGCSRPLMLNDLPKVVRELEVDAAEFTPTVVSSLLQGRESVPGLKLLLTIGEMLTQYIVNEYGGSSSRTSILWGMYGPTEAAIHCTLQPAFQSNSPVGNIGFPLDTVSTFIAAPASGEKSSPDILVLPRGETGELVVGGPQVAKEYLNRPELTNKAFIHHPEYGYLYRTGDRARILPDGTLECLGRIGAGQIKLRGQRIELGEIEQIISKVDGCHNVVALVAEENLVAFCAVGERSIAQETVIKECKQWLPSYMVPSDIIFLKSMPQLPSGKADKKALQASYLQRIENSKASSPQITDEKSLAVIEIIEEVLQRQVSLDATLSSAGLDSLRSIRLASLLRAKGYTLGAVDILSAPRIVDLLSLCDRAQQTPTALSETTSPLKEEVLKSAELEGLQLQIADVIPCSPLQEAMLAETVARPDAYCNWVETELSISCTLADIKAFVERLADVNEILRSGFLIRSTVKGSFAQIVWKNLASSQIVEVSQFSRKYSLGSTESLLRPLTVQVNATLECPRLLFQIPHALYDGWSFDLLLRDLHNLVNGGSLQTRAQYRDVVRYYSDIQVGGGLDSSITYWKNLLSDYRPSPLPNFNGKSIPSSGLVSMSRTSDVDLQKLQARAQEWQINPQVIFQAALAYLLGSYLGTTDVVFGTVTSGRTIPVTGIEEIMGPCIASLPLRIDLSTCTTVQSIMESIHSCNRSMLQHCTLPLREIKRICNVHARIQLFDVLFVWQESLVSGNGDSLAVKTIDSADELEFKLTLEIEPRPHGIASKVTWDSATVPEVQIKYLTRQVDELVNYFLDNQSSTVEQVGTCFGAQTRSIIPAQVEQTQIDAGPASLVERWAQECPDKEALILGTIVEGVMIAKDTLTYRALNERANQLAHFLLELGVSPDEPIALVLDKSINLYVSILAVLKAGAGYLPITPETPAVRISKILQEARVKFCLSESRFSERFKGAGSCTTFNMNDLDLDSTPNRNPDLPYNGSHLGYVIFTSGSTGTPKGVMVTQHNLMSNLRVLSEIYPTFDKGRLLQSCSQAFDVSVFEIFFTWYSGMCLCSAAKDDLFYNFEDSIDRLRITHLSLTPTVAALVKPENVPTVKFLVIAGEAMSESVKRSWAGKGLYQGYGPSETTNICTLRACVAPEDANNNIGPPLKNTSAFIFDRTSDSILHRGAIGELCIGGEQVFRGYLNQPELTANKIISHPTHGRLYRTGDLALLLPDDSILYMGRSDDQIKIRGQRVELGEISSHVADFDFVRDSLCLVLNPNETGQRLVAFWVPSDSRTNEFSVVSPKAYASQIESMFESLALKLPEYMVPTNLVPVTILPVTTTKVDKNLLISTFQALSTSFIESTAPQSPSQGEPRPLTTEETKIATALSHTIDVPVSDIHGNSSFFSLGLDSVSAIAFSKLLRESGFPHIPVSAILQNPTVSRLGSKLQSSFSSTVSSDSTLDNDVSAVIPREITSQIHVDFQKSGRLVERILPCTPLQEAMLSSARSEKDFAYCNTMVFNITGNTQRLRESWATVFRRHEILRTCFVPTEDPNYAFVQVITPYKGFEWDSLKANTESFGAEVEEYVHTTIPPLLQSYDPPIKLAYSNIDGATKLIFCCHHALYDGVAMAQLLREVEDAYKGAQMPDPVRYDGYLRQMMMQDLAGADQFWGRSLADFEPTFFPDLTGRPVRSDTAAEGHSTLELKLQMSLSEALTACQQSSISLLSMMQAVWAKLLHYYLGESDVCFGNVVSGRTLPEPDLERLVAPCFNTLPVRVNFDFGKSNSELVRHLHQFNLESMPFQLTPLRRIQANSQKEGGHIFDTLFILQHPGQALDTALWSLEDDRGDMDIPLVCEVSQDIVENNLALKIHYQHSFLGEKDATVIAETFDFAFASCVRFPELPARDTMAFPSKLLSNNNLEYSTFESPNGPLLHSSFEHNAVVRPDSIALEFQNDNGEKRVWTFKELNSKANQVAHALLERGVQPDDIVPVCMAKSPQFYISILGILKAGAAFSPFHPDLPEARKEYMLSETNPKVLLCVDTSPLSWCGHVPTLDVNSVEQYSGHNPIVRNVAPTNLAYCLYTSGSTGLPKAVGMEHRSPIQTVESSRSLIPWDHDSRLLQYAAITFDMCYYDCFLAWSFGFCLCAASQEAMLNSVVGVINSLKATLLDLTPSVAAGFTKADVPTVQYLYCIGEAMKPEIVNGWECSCVNSYGPTEAAFCCTIFPVSKDVKTAVIGKPFPTTSFSVFPKQGDRALPVFGVGELYIGGAQVARGYHSNAGLTESRFVQKNGRRLYKSGDMVRMLSTGNFEFIGRADDQVKIRGLRVELGEINNVLQESDSNVASVSTQILKRSEDSKEQLVAFLALKQSVEEKTIVGLRHRANEAAMKSLPSYMVPQFFIFVDKIPLSRAGKVDKAALTELFRKAENSELDADAGGSEEYEWSETETAIRQILSKLSKTPTEQILPKTTIHQLGLDSISAVQVAASLRRQGYSVSATDVLRHPSCYSLALALNDRSELSTQDPAHYDFKSFEEAGRPQVLGLHDVQAEGIEAIRPCTALQKGMISQFISKEGSVYFNHLKFRIDDDVDVMKLRVAWHQVMQRHPILRTGFVHLPDKARPFAMIQYASSFSNLPWEELKSENVSAQDISEWLRVEGDRAASNIHLPPWRIRHVRADGHNHFDLAIFHGLFDAQSLQAVFDDVVALYHDLPLTSPAPLDPVIGTILNLSSTDDVEQRKFWRRLGQGASPTKFPNMAPLRTKVVPPVVLSKLSSSSLSDIESGCRQSNITLQAAGLASWSSILSAYTGEHSVTCGVVLSGRTFESAESAVFPCITTVPFVCKMEENKKAVLEQIMSLTAGLQRYQFLPLNEIQKEMGYPNEPLFDSIFVYQKIPNSTSTPKLWEIVDEKATVDFPISIEMEPKEGRLEYRLTFLPHIVPSEQAHLILDQLDHLLTEFVFQEGPGLNNSYSPTLYSITPPKESSLPSDAALLHHFVEISAEKFPTRVAVEFATSVHNGVYASRWLNYEDFNAEGNRIANMLVARRVRPGSLVGICFDKCIEASTAILGILKAGCAFVALDPGAPVARKAYILQDSEAALILSMKAQSDDLQGHTDVSIVNIDELRLSSYSTSKPSLSRPISPQDRSYCLYTSGTTGNPKGCELTHENAVQAMLAFQRLFDGHWNETSRWLQFASFHFDVSVLEQFWSWSVGIRLVSAPRDVLFEDLANSLRVLGITHIDLTPSLARVLHPDDVPSLCRGVFITGGESLKQEILDVWGPKGVIYNGYGPTEATIGVTMYPRVPENGKPSNIGPQFLNVGSYVLRPNTDIPVLRGGMGELCVSGKLVGKGYLNRPELTKERFPVLERFNDRVYRTGDIVRILHDNTFDFLGRADDQVKLRGQRLEIGEINAVIKQSSSGISDVATLVLKHPKQQKEQLVAFIVTGSGSRGEPEILLDQIPELSAAKELCRERLPGYMIPTHFVTLTVMPLSPNNKADGRKLKQMYNDLSVADLQVISGISSGRDEVWTRDEEKIRDVLTEVAGVDANEVRKSSSFFELGLDSVSAITFSQGLKQAGFKKAQASLIMKNNSINRLARALADTINNSDDNGSITAAQQSITAIQHRHRRAAAETLGVDPREIEAIAPTTPLQQGMIARSLESERTLYFNAFRFELALDVDQNKLRDAWATLFKTTDILRTCFANTEDGFVQVVLKNPPFPWRFCSDAASDIDASMSTLREEWGNRNRAVLKQPFEVILISGPTHQYLVVHIFHGLYDGNSIALIFKAVWDIYHHRSDGISGPPFHSALPYGPLRIRDGAKAFWQKHLSGATYQPFPSPASESNQSAITSVRQIGGLSNYEAIRRKLNVTPQAIAQACWATILQSNFNGATTLGMIVSGRSLDFDGADRIIGPLFNTIPYHHRLEKGAKWSSIVKQCHEFNMAAHPYQHTPLRDIRKWCKLGPHQSLFDTLFVYQKSLEDPADMGDLWTLLDDESNPDYPLAVEIEQAAPDMLKLTLVSKENVLDKKLSEQLLEQFEDSLRRLLKGPDTIVKIVGAFEEPRSPTRIPEAEPHLSHVEDLKGFAWTERAKIIREEVAALSETELEDVNESTSILELGLDSIDAIKLSSKLKKRGIELSVSSIMRSLTITSMLQRISNDGKEMVPASSDMVFNSHKRRLQNYLHRKDLDQGDIERILPLTPLQEAMVAEMLSSEYKRYFNHDVLKIPRDTDMQRLQEAWNMVVRAAPILRTSFIEVDDPNVDYSYAQVVYKASDFQWQAIELETLDFTALFGWIRKDVVTNGCGKPLFQIRHVRFDDQSYLILSISHALYDGWSLGLLHDDVHRAYNGMFEPRIDYEDSLREILTASGSDAAAFWRDYLFDAKASLFPQRQHAQPSHIGNVHRQELPSQYPLSKISAFAKKNNITLQTLGQTAYALLLAFYVQSLDVIYGSVLSGRDNDEIQNVLFPTMNTVAIRTILHGTKREMLRYVQDNFTAVKQWQHFPLRKAQGMAGIRGALFDSLFIFQKRATSQENGNKALYESVEGQSDVEYPVCVEMEAVGDELIWRCACKEEVFSEAETKEFLTRLDGVLKDVMEKSDEQTIAFSQSGTVIGSLPPFTDAPDSGYDENSDASFDEPASPAEYASSATAKSIREVLAFVSKVPEDEIIDGMTIFHIGLDSISAIKVSSLLKKRSIILSVGDMLRAGTVEKMAQVVDERNSPTEHTTDVSENALRWVLGDIDMEDIGKRAGVSVDEIEQVLPASAGQAYMLSAWFNSGGTMFFPEFRFCIDNPIGFNVLQQSWMELVAANPVLRTILVAIDNTKIPYVQLIRKTSGASIFDTSDMDDDAEHQLAKKRLSSQPFLSIFAKRSEGGWSLKLKIHHSLYDGVSLPEIMQQFEDLCNGKPLPPPDNTFTQLLGASTTEAAQQMRKEFWTSYLKGAQHTQLQKPSQRTGPRVETFQPSVIPSIQSLEHRSRQHGLSIQSLFLATYAKLHATHLLGTTPKPQDIIIGIYLANRSHPIPSLTTAAIPTVNLVPLRITAPLENTLTDVAAQIQYDIQEISRLENASVALWEIAMWTDVRLDAFVNFLKLPDAATSNKNEEDCVKIRESGGLADAAFRRVVEMTGEVDESVLEKLRRDDVNGAYLNAIDIEATVRNGGLDVGVFGLESMIGLEKAEVLIQEVAKVLGEWESE